MHFVDICINGPTAPVTLRCHTPKGLPRFVFARLQPRCSKRLARMQPGWLSTTSYNLLLAHPYTGGRHQKGITQKVYRYCTPPDEVHFVDKSETGPQYCPPVGSRRSLWLQHTTRDWPVRKVSSLVIGNLRIIDYLEIV